MTDWIDGLVRIVTGVEACALTLWIFARNSVWRDRATMTMLIGLLILLVLSSMGRSLLMERG